MGEMTISFLTEDIKGLETSKEGFGKQVLLQRHETTELSVKLKMEIDSGNELKILSKERQDEITRLNESRELLEQKDETTELSIKLKTEINSSNKLKVLSKKNR